MSGLKLEFKKNTKLKLSVKNRTKIFTKDFVFALSIAFLVHFFAFTLFHIDLGLFSTTTEYPTAIVQPSDPSLFIDSSHQESKPLPIPSFLVFSKQQTPNYPSLIHSNKIALHEPSFDLAHLELDALSHLNLSHFHLSCGNTFQKAPTALQSKNICRAKLAFKASPISGKIFWLDWIESTGDRKLDYQIQEVLKASQIQKTHMPIASHGIIEIEFKA